MDNIKTNTHISQQFNTELEDIRSRVLAMGGLVEKQVYDAVKSLVEGDVKLAEEVIVNDYQVNAFEVAIDEECTQTLVRRQPAASDLRLIIAVIKTITDLERIGDQAEKVARMAIHLAETERPKNQYMEIMSLGRRAHEQLHKALDAFARMDVEVALSVAQEDAYIDQEYKGIIRQRITFMMEDPRLISSSLNVIWAARALERIGDHSKNLSEYVIYLVRGKDVRHISLEQMEIEARGDK